MPEESSSFDTLRWFYSRARKADSRLGLRHRLKDPLRPIRHVRAAFRGIREHGPLAEQLWKVSPRRQRRIYVDLFRRFGHSIEEFYFYRLCHREWRPHAAAFLSGSRMRSLDRLYRSVGVDVGLLRDKARFSDHCARAGLPAVPTILELDDEGPRWRTGEPGRTLSAGDVIVKPRDGRAGHGVRLFTKVPGGYRDSAGRELDLQALIDRLTREARTRPLIVQSRLRNASELSGWSSGALCTIRLVTTRGRCGPAELLLGLLRMPTADPVVDNLHRRGIAAAIDPGSGDLDAALPLNIPEVMKRSFIETHPVTRKRIAGARLAFWEPVVRLGLQAHESCGGFHSIGWDIALTDEGPILIEGNVEWGLMIAQYPGPSPLGRTRLPDHILACLDQSSRATRLPQASTEFRENP